VSTIGLPCADRARSSCHGTGPAALDHAGPGVPAWAGHPPPGLRLGAASANSRTRPVWRFVRDGRLPVQIEELASAAQFNLPYIHVLVNERLPGP